ncbi:MAG: efflux RND transporter permease subunit, partial [Pirellulaceae bacterium]|nr:efflux RND transporter permease subunit [Pirellulaceae bacterium]
MKRLIQWAVENSPAMNTLMIALMSVGALSLYMMRREMFPEFELEIVLVTVPYPGASPEEVEEGICQKIEEAVRSIAGIKKQTAVAKEGSGFLVLELETHVDAQKTLNEIRSEVDRIPSFPELAEDPEVKQITLRQTAIRVGVIGPDDGSAAAQIALREVAEEVREDLLQLPSISQANMIGVKNYQIDVEISEQTLRKHGLTLKRVAQIIRRENVEMPGGVMRGETQEVLLRGKNKRLTGAEIAEIPLVTQPNGVVLTLEDLGEVRDEFEDVSAVNYVDGKPAVVISVDRTSSEDVLAIAQDVNDYVARCAALGTELLPSGYQVRSWQNTAVDVEDRMHLLMRNGLQGLALVFLVLAIFLELRLALWVALGIPIAVLGAGAFLLADGHTLNMLSMFAFLMALGIVVDDAIVVGENIYAHRQQGKAFARAAVEGAYEVLPSVAASVTTTIIAFAPMLYVSGVMGKFIAVMPIAVIAMLVISLVESTTVLPCHLAHETNLFMRVLGIVFYPLQPVGWLLTWLNQHTARLLEQMIMRFYRPSLRWSLKNPAIVISASVAILVFSFGLIRAGHTPWLIFPKLDSKWIEARITYPDGTSGETTEAATLRLEEAIYSLDEKYGGTREKPAWITLVNRTIGEVTGDGIMGPDSRSNGSHIGAVFVEMEDTTTRPLHSDQVLAQWREAAGEFPGVEQVVFKTPEFGPGGAAIEFKLLANAAHMEVLQEAAELCQQELAKNEAVVDIRDDLSPGKWEYRLKVKDRARAMGVTVADLAETVRGSYYGEEVMRLQRGRHEVKLMVRYPRSQRGSLADFDEIRVRLEDGAERPLTELAAIDVERGFSEVNRVDQLRSITVTADVLEDRGNANRIVGQLAANFVPKLLGQEPFRDKIQVRWEGQREQSQESLRSLFLGFGVALLAMFMLLTVEFRSYFQPLLILMIIPFGFVGAIWGHALRGLPLTMFSMFGLVALTGVVVNDSIVLIDFINHRIRAGQPLVNALLEAGHRRFRPVLLTSITTIAGLLPLLTETSFQAQVLIPMAVSMAFGLLLATVLVLYLIPTFYYVYARLAGLAGSVREEVAEAAVSAQSNA